MGAIRMWRTAAHLLLLQGVSSAAGGDDIATLLDKLRAVGPHGVGQREAARAWDALAETNAAQLPLLLEALDEAGPLAANWIRTVIDAVAEREWRAGGELPLAALERFLRERKHDPRARRLAYEWLVRVDPASRKRLLEELLDDPSVELRRDAVAELIRRGGELMKQARSSPAADVYRRAFDASRDRDQSELLADRLQKLGRPVDLTQHFGFLTRWRVIGPFDNTDQLGFDVAHPPETAKDVRTAQQGIHGQVAWTEHVTRDEYGKVDFNALLGEQKAVCAYAAAVLFSSSERPAELRFQTGNAVKVWLNGALIASHNIYHSGDFFDQYVAGVKLRSGDNPILVKVCQNAQTESWARNWQFRLRVCDAAGGAIVSPEKSDKDGQGRQPTLGKER